MGEKKRQRREKNEVATGKRDDRVGEEKGGKKKKI